MCDNLYYKLKSYLRKLGETNHYKFGVDNSNDKWEIVYWNYDNVPKPDVNEVPNLTEEELFHEEEDENTFSADVFIVDSDGTIRADRRMRLSGLDDEGNIVLDKGRYLVETEPPLKLYVDGKEVRRYFKVIGDATRIDVEVPSEGESVVILWQV